MEINMAKKTLAVRPLSFNDLSTIARLFEVSFDVHLNNPSLSIADYLCSLRTLVGLGFTAALADKELLGIYQTYLRQFLALHEGDFQKGEGAKKRIAQSLAEMVDIAIRAF